MISRNYNYFAPLDAIPGKLCFLEIDYHSPSSASFRVQALKKSIFNGSQKIFDGVELNMNN